MKATLPGGEVQPADPAARRRAFGFVAAATFTGAVALVALARGQPLIEGWLADPAAARQRLPMLVAALALAIGAPLAAFAAYLWLRGAKVRRARRFPLEHERLIRDTPVVVGQAAELRGRVLQGLAVTLAVAAALLMLLLWRLVATIAAA